MDAMKQAKDKGHDMGPFGAGTDPVWPLPESKCRKCGLKLFQYEDTGNIYGAAALLSCQEMQKINNAASSKLVRNEFLMSERRWVEWESIAEHTGTWIALARHPDRRKREQALKEYPMIFEEVKTMLVVLTDMSSELKRIMVRVTELADAVIRENQVDPIDDRKTLNSE